MKRDETCLDGLDAAEAETPLSYSKEHSQSSSEVTLPTRSSTTTSMESSSLSTSTIELQSQPLSLKERCSLHRWSSLVEIESRKHHQEQQQQQPKRQSHSLISRGRGHRISIHKINSDARMQASQNSHVEALAKQSIQQQQQQQHTASSTSSSCSRIPLEETLSYWQLIKRHVQQGTFAATKSILKQTKKQKSKNTTSPNTKNSLVVVEQPLHRRHSYRVRFATDVSTSRTWSLTRQFDKVPRELHKDIWWTDTEQSFFYETMWDDLDEEGEDEYGHLLQTAYESVPCTQPSEQNALINFSSFVICSEAARGLESYMCVTIGTHVQRHRAKVLATYKQLTAASGMEDDIMDSNNPLEVGDSIRRDHDCTSSSSFVLEPYWLTPDLITEIVALRSLKYSHSCRMVAAKLGACDGALRNLPYY